jgi:putative heme-binding domain-containing protein
MTIDGLMVAGGNPMTITSTGGLTQLIPADRIKAQRKLKHSLMLNADQLGLTAQDVADLVEYLKQN